MAVMRRAALGLLGTVGCLGLLAVTTGAAGPPFPEPIAGQNVYDEAGIWSAAAEAQAEGIIDAIEARVAAQVVAYSQDVDGIISNEEAKQQAAALGTQWGVGRGGFNDGLVLLFDIERGGLTGEVVFVSGDGFRNAYLSDEDTTRIFEEEMLPYLQGGRGRFDEALIAGLEAVDEAATPQRAAFLQTARVVNAVLGLIVAPIIGLALIAWAVFHWLRFGRDPFYLDSPSILMPAPPAELTAATGALIWDGRATRRALTTALLDLASRGRIAFEDRPGFLSRKVAVVTEPTETGDQLVLARQSLADRRPLAKAEEFAETQLKRLGRKEVGHVLEGDDLLGFGKKVDAFDEKLEAHAVTQGWFRAAPGKVRKRWRNIGIGELILGGASVWAAGFFSISGFMLVGGAFLVAGAVTFVVAMVMPARTMAGAITRAMLAAYRRTLQKTMEQARSMDQVVAGVAAAGMSWIETPDQALVWSVALGLQDEVDDVLRRSTDDIKDGRADPTTTYAPAWYGPSGSGGHGGWGSGGGGSIFSGSAVPSLGGMVAVLGSVGNAPSSSGGGSGGFGGGGGFSGGGGGSF